MVNTNKLVRNYEGCTGLKTGSTSLALYNLSASATRDELSVIAVIMKAPTSLKRFSEAEKLLNYGFNNFEYKEFGRSGETIKKVKVAKGIKEEDEVIFSYTAGVIIEKGKEKDIVQKIILPDVAQAPIFQGDKLGEIKFYLDDKEISSVDLIAKYDVKKVNILNMIGKVLDDWFYCLR